MSTTKAALSGPVSDLKIKQFNSIPKNIMNKCQMVTVFYHNLIYIKLMSTKGAYRQSINLY